MAVLALAVAAGCDSKKEAVMTSGIDLTNLDTTAVQGADFYQYACGGWMKKHPLTNEYSRFGSFDMLAENNREQLKGLIVEIAAGQNAQGTIGQKIGDIYNLAMDSVKLNADGVTPIQADLEKIASVKDKSEIVPLMAELAHSGVFPYFSFYVGADIMDSKSNLFQLYQGGISLGEKEYYLDNDDVTVNIRNKYKEHIVKMFQLAGFDEAAAKKKMEAVMDIETRIAKASFSAVEQRNPAANYHKMSLDELKKEIPGIDWDAFLNGIGVKGVTELSVSQVEPIKEVEKIINSLPVENQIAYMQWSLIDRAAGYLSDDLVAQNFDFYGKIIKQEHPNDLNTIVNKYYQLDETYEPSDLVEINTNAGTYGSSYSKHTARKVIYDDFQALKQACINKGFELYVTSGYRSTAWQKEIYNHMVETYSVERADETCSRPGHSEHTTGLGLDIALDQYKYEEVENHPQYSWFLSQLSNYGFILRYPKDKEELTGYSYEAWHIRYVGKDLAQKIEKSGLTFDEYYARNY